MVDRKWAAALAGVVGGALLLLAMAPSAYAQGAQPTTAVTTSVTVPTYIEITLNSTSINFGTVSPSTNSSRFTVRMNITDNTNVDVNFTFRPDTNMSIDQSNMLNFSGINRSSGVFQYNVSFDNDVSPGDSGSYAFHPEGVAFATYTANLTGFFDRARPAAGSNTSTDLHLWTHVPSLSTAGSYTGGQFTIRASRCEVNC